MTSELLLTELEQNPLPIATRKEAVERAVSKVQAAHAAVASANEAAQEQTKKVALVNERLGMLDKRTAESKVTLATSVIAALTGKAKDAGKGIASAAETCIHERTERDVLLITLAYLGEIENPRIRIRNAEAALDLCTASREWALTAAMLFLSELSEKLLPAVEQDPAAGTLGPGSKIHEFVRVITNSNRRPSC